MGIIKRIDYFKKNKEKVLNQLSFSYQVFRLLDNDTYVYKQKSLEGEKSLIKVFEKRNDSVVLVHSFLLEGKQIHDQTCSKNCPYLYALAIKMGWLKLPVSGLPVTQWRALDGQEVYKWRMCFKNEKFFVEYKDKYGKKFIEFDFVSQITISLFDLQKQNGSNGPELQIRPKVKMLEKLIKQGNASWLNLKPFRSVDLSRTCKKSLRLD